MVGPCRLLLFGVRRDPGRGIVEPQTDTPVEVANPRAVGRRRVLSGVALLLACLTILLATVAVWVHQVAFNTDRFTGPRRERDRRTRRHRSAEHRDQRAGRRGARRPDPDRGPAARRGEVAGTGHHARHPGWDRQPPPGRPGQAAGPGAPAQDRLDRAYPGHEPAARQPGRGERGRRLRDDRGVAAGPGRAQRAAVGRTAPRRGPDPRPVDVGGSGRPRPAAVHARSGSRCRPTSARSA